MKAKPTAPQAYDAHLQTVQSARENVDAAVATLDQARGLANHAIKATWEFLFDHLCRGGPKKLSIPQLNMVAGITCRLIQSMQKLGELEADTRARNQVLAETLAQAAGLPSELREQLERELKVM